MRWTSRPGWRMGSMNTVSPRCFGTSQLVRARHSPQSDHQAPVVQIFEPFEHPLVTVPDGGGQRPATSEPPLGSERNCIQISSPRRMAGMCRCFCSSVPKSRRTAAQGDEGRGLEPGGILVAGQLGIERPLVLGREPLTAVLPGEADAGQAGVEEHPLDLPLPGHGGQLFLVGPVVPQGTDRCGVRDRPQIGPDEGPGPLPEALEVLPVSRTRCAALQTLGQMTEALPVLAPAFRRVPGSPCAAEGRGGCRDRRSGRCPRGSGRSPA